MYPTILKFGDIVISSYSVMVLIAYMVGYILLEKEIVRRGYNAKIADICLIATLIGGLGGAKILFILQQATWTDFINDPIRYFASGYTFLGGFAGSFLMLILVSKIRKINFWSISDAICPSVVIAYGIGRIGCLLVGDDYGIPSNLPWAISFPKGSPPIDIPVHPTQIYDTIFMSILFLILWKIRKRVYPPGWLASVGFSLLAVERFFIEFIRETSPSFIQGISQAQIMSLALIAIFIARLIYIFMKYGQKIQQKPN
ncbi:MAG: prolipoprotein diacylglyceryl transferase [Thermodesulfobacteriota bacterium]